MNPFANIGHRIYSLRSKRGWTQQELADRVNQTVYRPGVKQPHIAGLEKSKGEKLPSVPVLAALAEVFEIDMQTLVGIDSGRGKREPADDLLAGLKSEDKALALALISRLRHGLDSMDSDWRRLSESVAANGGSDMVNSFESDIKVFLETTRD